MTEYSVKITARALSDMEAIYEYIADELQVPDTALNQYNRIAESIESLAVFPERCRMFESASERALGMRLKPVDNYSIIFIADDLTCTVTVLRVLYSASDLITRLRENI